jgi:hypothetical protein
MKWARYVACMKDINAYEKVVGKSAGKKSLLRLRR